MNKNTSTTNQVRLLNVSGVTPEPFDGSIKNLFTDGEVIIACKLAYFARVALGKNVIQNSSMNSLFEQSYLDSIKDSLPAELAVKSQYEQYSTVQDGFLRILMLQSCRLASSIPDVDLDSYVEFEESFMDSFEFISRNYSSEGYKSFPTELYQDENLGVWQIIYDLLDDPKVHSSGFGSAAFSDAVEQFVIDSKVIDHKAIPQSVYDSLAQDTNFNFLKWARTMKLPVPCLDTERFRLPSNEGERFKRFVELSAYAGLALDIKKTVDELLSCDQEKFNNWRAAKRVKESSSDSERECESELSL